MPVGRPSHRPPPVPSTGDLPVIVPPFQVVDKPGGDIPPRAMHRKDWTPLVNTLIERKLVWALDGDITDHNLKYLANTFLRRANGERFRYLKEYRNGKKGWLMWIDRDDDPVPSKKAV